MERERNSKKILIGVLCAIILFMSIGFATMGANLQIEGDAAVGSTWNVQITSISLKDATDGVEEVADPSYGATSASFNVTLSEPGDTVSYDVVVSNQGTINAVLDAVNVSQSGTAEDGIVYSVDGPTDGESLNAGTQHTYTVTVTYPETAKGENAPANNSSKHLTVTMDYSQAANQTQE